MNRLIRSLLWLAMAGAAATRLDAATLTVNAGGNLQSALDSAKPGDVILLEAGATFTGQFVLPAKGGSTYITIRSSASDSSLPAAGVRMTPSYASSLPKIRVTSTGTGLRTAPGASYWRLQFIEFVAQSGTTTANLLEFGDVGGNQTNLSTVPGNLILDRCYLHGDPATGQRRGLALNSGDTQIVNSYFSDFKTTADDTQAIAGWNGPGPYLIQNNYIEAAGENILFGGSDPGIANLIPSDITIRRNLITKPISWRGQGWVVKNHIELKNAQRLMIDGNVFENVWTNGQQGYSIMMSPRNQDHTAPWSAVRHITIQNNIFRHVATVINIAGYDDEAQSQQTEDIVIRNNLAYDVSTAYGTSSNPASGWLGVIGGGPTTITIDHNTVNNDGNSIMVFYGGYAPTGPQIWNFQLTNNLFRDNLYGMFGADVGMGTIAFTTFTPSAVVLRNAFAGSSIKAYPTGNDYPTIAQWLQDFVNAGADDYRLNSSSLSKTSGTDGKDLGVDFTELNAALNGTGSSSSSSSSSSGSTTSSVSTPHNGATAGIPGTIQAKDFDDGGEGVAYHDSSSGNDGGQYRFTDVDIEGTTDTGGGYNIGWISAGEWLNYTVNVSQAGTYTLTARVAANGPGGTFHIEVDGADKTGALNIPDSGGWQTWTTLTKTGVSLTAGSHVVRIAIDASGSSGIVGNINWINFASSSSASSGSASSASASTAHNGVIAAVPGTIQAEDFDDGGEGVAFHDSSSGNAGGQYRFDGVDIEAASDSGGGYDVGWIAAGEWLNYTVNVSQAGTYTLTARVAANGAGGTFHIEVDGADKTGALNIPDSGGWQSWTTLTKAGVSLSAGSHVVRIAIDASGSSGIVGNINWIKFASSGSLSTPHDGVVAALPGTIQAEAFDDGGEGIAYHDSSSGNSGGEYRSEGVDIESTSDSDGGYNVGWMAVGEWLNYTVNVSQTSTYTLAARVAASGEGGTFHVEVDGVNKTGTLTIPNTNGWQTWTTVTKTGVSMTSGSHVLRVVVDSSGSTGVVGNINWIKVQ